MNVAIIGASGYTGLELVRILSRHPNVRISALTSEKYAGHPFHSVFPSFQGNTSLQLEPLKPDIIVGKADFIFTALPHKEAMEVVPFFIKKNKRVIDLSADFRFSCQATYEAWYQAHSAPALLADAIYGLPEINRSKIRRARLVANPGCYPTSIILPLAPLLRENLAVTGHVIADAKSGVSGAGRSLKTASLFSEVSEGFRAYNIMSHRHQPEIVEQLSTLAGADVSLLFAPHLVPMNRGILSTIYVTLRRTVPAQTIRSILRKYYGKEKFIRLYPEGTLPGTGWVRGSNFCDIGFCLKGKNLVLVSAIDNLVKGAAGQAVQNMNIMMRVPEDCALQHLPLYP